MSQYNVSNTINTELNNNIYRSRDVEIWKLYRSNYYNNPLTEKQALDSGNYSWIEFNNDIWISSNFCKEVKLLIEKNPKVLNEPNYPALVGVIRTMINNPELLLIDNYAKRAVKPSPMCFINQLRQKGLYGIIGSNPLIDKIKNKLVNVPFISELDMPLDRILAVKNLPVIIDSRDYIKYEEFIIDFKYVWHI